MFRNKLESLFSAQRAGVLLRPRETREGSRGPLASAQEWVPALSYSPPSVVLTMGSTSRCFFYITNDWESAVEEIVFEANGRCNQENLIEQQKNGVCALTAPLDNLESNWAYMVMASLAWTFKAWAALLLPVQGRWREQHETEKRKLLRMDFATFRNALINVPAQIVRTSRRIIYRFLSWNPWQRVFFRLLDAFRLPLRC